MSLILRRFTPKDLAKVVYINRKCLPENYSESFFMQLHRSFPEAFLVADDGGDVVAYIMCRVERGFFGSPRKGHVISIAVLPQHRRKGIAYALMVEAMKALHALGAEECYLEVRVSNTPAINLYEKLGFKIDRRVHGYYLDGEDAYIMRRKLPLEDEILNRPVRGISRGTDLPCSVDGGNE